MVLLTYSMVQSPSWEANWFAGSQEIPFISRNSKVHYRIHKRPPPVSILGQPNPVNIHTFHLLEIHPNIIHPSTPRSPQWSPSQHNGIVILYYINMGPPSYMPPLFGRIFSIWRKTVFRQYDELLLHSSFPLLYLSFPVFLFFTFLSRFSFLTEVQGRILCPTLRPQTLQLHKSSEVCHLRCAIWGVPSPLWV